MTLLLALANERHAALVADRRVTVDGKLADDEYNKLCILFCNDAKLAVGFTGLATLQAFDTATWLAETLSEIANVHADIAPLLAELQVRASSRFSSLVASDSRLSILFVGFVYWSERPEPRAYVLSNFDGPASDPPTFSLRTISVHDSVIVEPAGTISGLPITALASLRALMQKALPPQALIRFAVGHLQRAARDSRSSNRIGEQLNTAVLLAQPDTAVISTYHSAKYTHRAYGANVVVAGAPISLGIEIFGTSVLAGPEIRKHDPCWCGSGSAFKHCHMKKYGSVYARHAAFKKPLPWFVRCGVESPRATGKVFCVASSFD